MNQKQFNEWMGIPMSKGNSHPFKMFFSKQEELDYLLKNHVITREQHFLRSNPELCAKRELTTTEPY